MRSRKEISQIIASLGDSAVPDVRTAYVSLRDDLAETLADLAADILLHQEGCAEALDGLPDEAFEDASVAAAASHLEAPVWNLVVEDFRRLARWIPRQRLARFGEEDAIGLFRDRLVAAVRPALVELQRYEMLPHTANILRDDYWNAKNLYDLAVRYEGFTLALYRAVESRIHRDKETLDRLHENHAEAAVPVS